MVRIAATSLVAVALCALESGCCCRCGVPFFRPPPIVIQAPPQVGINPAGPAVEANSYTYVQATGQLKRGNDAIGAGYSGKGPARNNRAFQNQKDKGPIPVGEYIITGRQEDFKTGEPIVNLMPAAWTDHFQRWPGEPFTIGPESNPPGNAGGIVMPRDVREKMEVNGTKLIVQ